MKIALGQINVKWKDEQKNKETCEEFIKVASQRKVDLIIFPEMTLTGASNNVPYLSEASKDSDKYFKNMAKKYNINICFGYARVFNEKCENNLMVVSKEGKELCNYTKIHLFSHAKEDDYFNAGDKISFFDFQDTVFSTFICHDLKFPEIFEAASKKAEVIIVIANWPQVRREHWRTLLRARAIENQCFILGVNRVGQIKNLVYTGDSMIIDPLGNVLKENYGDEALIIADIDPKETDVVREKYAFRKDRREKLYAKLLSEI